MKSSISIALFSVLGSVEIRAFFFLQQIVYAIQLLPNFPIEDTSIEVPINEDWKTYATKVLQSCDMLVCIVSEDTHKSEPIDWEIREAYQLGIPLIVTTLDENNELPPVCKELPIEVIPWNALDVAGKIGEMLLPKALFLGHDWSTGAPQPTALSQQYNIMVQSWESLIARRQTVNTVYISANSALLAGVGVLVSSIDRVGYGWVAAGGAVIAFLGAALSFNWRRTILSYGILSRAKAKVVATLEAYMPARLFDAEWHVLEARQYKSTTETDKQTAQFFLLLFIAIFFVTGGIAIGQWI